MTYNLKEEQREYQRVWRENRYKEVHRLLGGACSQCGSTEELEIDHIDPPGKSALFKHTGTRGFNVSLAWTTILAELHKCQLLCKRHHQEKTNRETLAYTHGTRTMYLVHKCKCEKCRGWNTRNVRERRARKKAREEN